MSRALCLLIALLSPSLAGAKTYTLDELLRKVRADYPGVVAARESIGAADAQLSQARRLWAPTGQLTAGFTLAPSVQCQSVLARDASQNPIYIHDEANCTHTTLNPADITNEGALHLTNPAFNLQLQLIQPIYSSGKIEAAIRLAHAGEDAARAQAQAAVGDVALLAVRAYWALKWSRASGATLDDGIGRIRDWVKSIDADLEKPKPSYTETDLARLKLALDTTELARQDIQRAERTALAGVRTLTGDADADIDATEMEITSLLEQPIAWYEDAARTHRPEAKLLEAARAAAHQQRNLRLAEMLPDLGLVGSFNYSIISNVDDPQNAFMNHPNALGVGLYLAFRQPLDIVEKLARFDQARAEERSVAAKRREALGGIAFEIERSWYDADEARARQEKTAHGEKVARGWYNAVDQNLQVGTAESRDMVDAARNYFEMRLRHLQSIMDLNVSVAALKRAAGVD
jgi:outer membrane protein